MPGIVPHRLTNRSRGYRRRFSWTGHVVSPKEAPAMTEPRAQSTYPGHPATNPHIASPDTARSTYRQLVSKGLDHKEAANLTACMNRISVSAQAWAINEVSHVLFLRSPEARLPRQTTRWCDAVPAPRRPGVRPGRTVYDVGVIRVYPYAIGTRRIDRARARPTAVGSATTSS